MRPYILVCMVGKARMIEGTGSMRVWLTEGDGIEGLRQAVVDDPVPGPREILLRTVAVALNYRDLLVIRGEGTWKPNRPIVPISDAAGVVEAIGSKVTRFERGDVVLPTFLPKWRSGPLTAETYTMPTGGPRGRGMLAEFVTMDEQEAVRAPRTLDAVQAATLPVAGVTAWHALRRTGISPGTVVLVHGTGGVALMALQIAAAVGAEVIVTSGRPHKLDRARVLGARHTIDRRRLDVAAEVRRLTGGVGADIVIETIGGSNLDVSLDAVRIGGHIAFIGLLAGLKAEVSTYKLVTTNATLHGIETGSREMLEELVAFIDAHRVVPVIDSTHRWEDIATALRHLEAGTHLGKVVVTA
ncbi:NAD(P)-dependent alcohol dehydrogenase [Dactylosporangium sp. NPDC051541]|uniref:NAD(P)-dependent alcohol dehydrogenase n=1 Tax=Dactylosporangium sp. NPDC051541 TaxID=3363977 RepID=UPI0037B8E0A3